MHYALPIGGASLLIIEIRSNFGPVFDAESQRAFRLMLRQNYRELSGDFGSVNNAHFVLQVEFGAQRRPGNCQAANPL